MKFNSSNKFDLSYYGQVNSIRVKSSVTSKWASKHLWGYYLFCWRWYIGGVILFFICSYMLAEFNAIVFELPIMYYVYKLQIVS